MSVVTDGYKELTLDQGQASKVIIFGMMQFLIMYFFCKSKPFFLSDQATPFDQCNLV